ncbi:MAG: hypothetical protein LUO89_11180 [Methanothrix sp.]|nr:hypothetical protein [Methanothrix sp.]
MGWLVKRLRVLCFVQFVISRASAAERSEIRRGSGEANCYQYGCPLQTRVARILFLEAFVWDLSFCQPLCGWPGALLNADRTRPRPAGLKRFPCACWKAFCLRTNSYPV